VPEQNPYFEPRTRDGKISAETLRLWRPRIMRLIMMSGFASVPALFLIGLLYKHNSGHVPTEIIFGLRLGPPISLFVLSCTLSIYFRSYWFATSALFAIPWAIYMGFSHLHFDPISTYALRQSVTVTAVFFAGGTLRLRSIGWLLKLAGAVTLFLAPVIAFRILRGMTSDMGVVLALIIYLLNAIAWCWADFGKLGHENTKDFRRSALYDFPDFDPGTLTPDDKIGVLLSMLREDCLDRLCMSLTEKEVKHWRNLRSKAIHDSEAVDANNHTASDPDFEALHANGERVMKHYYVLCGFAKNGIRARLIPSVYLDFFQNYFEWHCEPVIEREPNGEVRWVNVVPEQLPTLSAGARYSAQDLYDFVYGERRAIPEGTITVEYSIGVIGEKGMLKILNNMAVESPDKLVTLIKSDPELVGMKKV